MLAVGGYHRVIGGQRPQRSGGHRLLADIQMEESPNLGFPVQLRALLFHAAHPHHVGQQASRKVMVGHIDTARMSGSPFVSTVDVSPSGSPSSRAFSKRRMIFPLRVCGSVVDELDFLRRDRGAQPLARVAEQFQPQLFVGGEPVLERDERLHHLADRRVRFADDCCLGDRRMIGQRVFHLERSDQVPGGLDHVVGAADEPEVAVGVALGEIPGEVEPVGEALAVALLLVQVAAEHRRPARLAVPVRPRRPAPR